MLQLMMRKHLLAGVPRHTDEFATLLDKIPFFIRPATLAGWLGRDEHRVYLSWFLLREPPRHAARVYLQLACDDLMRRQEMSVLQLRDVFDRFDLDPVFESEMNLWPQGSRAPFSMRVVAALERIMKRSPLFMLTRTEERVLDVLAGIAFAAAIFALHSLPAPFASPPVAEQHGGTEK